MPIEAYLIPALALVAGVVGYFVFSCLSRKIDKQSTHPSKQH